MKAHFLQIKLFQNIQHLYNMAAPGGRRSHRNHIISSVGSPDRHSFDWGAFFQILFYQDAFMLLYVLHNIIGNRPVIEPIHSVPGHALQRIRKIRICDNLTIFPWFSFIQIKLGKTLILRFIMFRLRRV